MVRLVSITCLNIVRKLIFLNEISFVTEPTFENLEIILFDTDGADRENHQRRGMIVSSPWLPHSLLRAHGSNRKKHC